MKKKRPRRSSCPISYVLDIFGDKWTLLVIRDLAFSPKRYFQDFSGSAEGIASNILTDRLKTLEASGLVSKRQDPANARKIIYELTEKGEDLIPALLELGRWGAKYDADTAAPKHYIRRIEKDRDRLLADIKSFLKKKRAHLT